MSLIETAIHKAMQLADGKSQQEPVRSVPRHSRSPQPDVETVRLRAAQARQFQPAAVDDETMEQRGVMLRVTDLAAERSYRILRTRVQQRMAMQGWHSVAITSAAPGEGKTLTAINLALALARDVDTYVFLVDLDLHRPQIGPYLGMRFDKHIEHYLAGEAQFEEVVYSPGIERLAIIPSRSDSGLSSEVLNSNRMRELHQALAAEIPRRIVIFDMPPMLMSDDVLRVAPNVDCLMLVVAEGVAPRAGLQNVREALQSMNLLGTVLNKSMEREQTGYYY